MKAERFSRNISKRIHTFQSDSSPHYVFGTWNSNFFQKFGKISLKYRKGRIHIRRLLACLRCRLRLRHSTSSSMQSRFCCRFNRHRRCRLPNCFVVVVIVIFAVALVVVLVLVAVTIKNVSFKCPFSTSFSLSPSTSAFLSLVLLSIVFFGSLFTQIKKYNSPPLTARK